MDIMSPKIEFDFILKQNLKADMAVKLKKTEDKHRKAYRDLRRQIENPTV